MKLLSREIQNHQEMRYIAPVLTEVAMAREPNDHNDCGALAVEMLLLTDFPELADKYSLATLRELLNKEGDQATIPGNICKLLKESGYDVSYYSQLDWQKYADADRVDFENDRLKQLEGNFASGFIDAKKWKQSAEWLMQNSNVIETSEFNFETMAKALTDGARVISIVGGDHYVVVTGLDTEFVYMNDPNFSAPRKMALDFFKQWSHVVFDAAETIVAKPRTNK